MSATTIGYNQALISDTSFEQSKEGIINYTVRSLIPIRSTVTTPNLSATTIVGTDTLRAVSINVTSSAGAFQELVVTYQGGKNTSLQQDASNSTGEEPIETNPYFQQQDAIGSPSIVEFSGGAATLQADGSVVGTGGALFNLNGGFEGFRSNAKYNFFGVSSYLNPDLVYRRSFVTDTKPDVSKVGRIVDPTSDFPTVTAGSTWLCLGISYTKKGTSYDVTHDFRASSVSGWNIYIYGTAVSAPSIT
jgi:hypothetical protein